MGVRSFFHAPARAFGRGQFPACMAWVLRLPVRRLLTSPEALAARMRLAGNENVLEVGCGAGYYSAAVAQALPRGQLFLLDRQPGMVSEAKRALSALGVRNASYACADACALPYTDESIDAAFLVTVLGEIERPDAALSELFRVLKPGARLWVTEHRTDPDFVSLGTLRRFGADAGFAYRGWVGRRWAFSAAFEKPPRSA